MNNGIVVFAQTVGSGGSCREHPTPIISIANFNVPLLAILLHTNALSVQSLIPHIFVSFFPPSRYICVIC